MGTSVELLSMSDLRLEISLLRFHLATQYLYHDSLDHQSYTRVCNYRESHTPECVTIENIVPSQLTLSLDQLQTTVELV